MRTITQYDKQNSISELLKNELIDFLFTHMGIYGDTKEEMSEAMDYAMGISSEIGGFILVMREENSIIGVSVVLKTGMCKFIPDNILVYLAIHNNHRKKGLAKNLIMKIKELTIGGIALHVEPNNPAIKLYEKEGFKNKYLEMRFVRD